MHALVLDGGVKSALAVVRSLGKRGISVTVGHTAPTGLALWSRYAAHTFVYRSPIDDPTGFLDDLEHILLSFPEPPVVYCMSDATVLLLSRARARFAGRAKLVLPDEAALETAADKYKTQELAASLKIPTPPPATYTSFPVVVKPRHSAAWFKNVGVRGHVQFAFSETEARVLIETIATETGEEPLVQEWVRGAEFGFEALCHRGEVLAFVGHRRMRSLSPRGGAAVVKTTVALDAGMEAHARAILKSLMWEGVAMVEFKQASDSGTPYLLEINPRFWGSLPLAIHAGVDFPFLFGLLAEGRLDHIEALTREPYEHRVTSRHFLGDLRHLKEVLLAKDPLRPLIYPSRPRALLDFIAPGPRVHRDVFEWGDPLPCIMEIIDHI